tara:strand:+ start:383 stop:853 length:471 start_codon:yes stop_codon:yes gene_type:complete
MGQAIGFTQAFPNATFVDGGTSAGTPAGDSILIPIADIEGLTDAEANDFSVVYAGTFDHNDNGTATDQGGTYTGNCEKIIWGILKKYEAIHKKIDAAYTADQALSTPTGTDAGPEAIAFGNGFGNLQSAPNGRLKQTITLTFLYPEPAVDLLNEDD